jgi:hypothetical protein
MTWSQTFFVGLLVCTAAGLALIIVGRPMAAVPEIMLGALCTIGYLATSDDE